MEETAHVSTRKKVGKIPWCLIYQLGHS